MFGAARPVHIGWLLPLFGVTLNLDPLGGFFIALTGAVAIPVGVYAIGYAHHMGRVPLAVLPLFVAAMLLVPAAASVTTFLLAWELMAIASLVLVLTEHTRPEVAFGGPGVCGDDPARLRGHPDRPDGVVRGGRRGPVRRPDAGARRRADRGLPVDGGRLRVEGGPGAAARLAAARAPGGAEPGVGADERGDGESGRLRHRPVRSAAAGPRPPLVGADAAGRRCGVGAVRGVAGLGGDGSQTAACLFDNREHGVGHPCPGGGHVVRGLRRARAGHDRDGRGDAAFDRACGVQVSRLLGGGIGAGRHRVA